METGNEQCSPTLKSEVLFTLSLEYKHVVLRHWLKFFLGGLCRISYSAVVCLNMAEGFSSAPEKYNIPAFTEGISPGLFGDATHTIYRTQIYLLQIKENPGEIPSVFVSGVGMYEVMSRGDFSSLLP